MTVASDLLASAAGRTERIDAFGRRLKAIGLGWTVPFVKLAAGEERGEQLKIIGRQMVLPLLGIVVFAGLWAVLAPRVDTSLGAVPGPVAVWGQAIVLVQEHQAERDRAAVFHAREAARHAELVASGNADEVKQ